MKNILEKRRIRVEKNEDEKSQFFFNLKQKLITKISIHSENNFLGVSPFEKLNI